MANIGEIDKAIAAHLAWKAELRAAIESGVIGIALATIRDDTVCEFGIWFAGHALTDDQKRTLECGRIEELHAHFHNVAGRVAELAVGGNKAIAEEVMAHSFETASAVLTAALIECRDKLRFVDGSEAS